MRVQKGQSTVEYVLLVTAVIAVIIVVTNPTSGIFTQRVNQVFTQSSQDMINVASYLQDNAAPSQ
jgi:Flp pilus assembly pilin Flp